MVQNLHSRFIQPTAIQLKPEAYRRVLGWAYPSRGLPWTWKYSYKCTQTLSAACWSQAVVACSKAEAVNDCYSCSCSVFNYIPDQLLPRPSRLRDARCSGGKMTWYTRGPKFLFKPDLIHMHPWNISFESLDWSLTNFFHPSFATTQRNLVLSVLFPGLQGKAPWGRGWTQC